MNSQTVKDADFPECSRDPGDCPENEGRGCCKPNPPTDRPVTDAATAAANEIVKQFRRGFFDDNMTANVVAIIDKHIQSAQGGDGPDTFDCPHASAARLCGCGFCKALNTAPAAQVDDAMVERAHHAYWNFNHESNLDDHKVDRDAMRAALTAALNPDVSGGGK